MKPIKIKLEEVDILKVTGDQGIQGIQGQPGKDGVQGGVGPQGLEGRMGKQGEKGDKGDKGDRGEQGKDGKDFDEGKFKSEIYNRIGTGNMNRQIKVEGVDVLKKYTDINLINATAVTNESKKRVDITFSSGGGTPSTPDTSVQFNDGGSFGGTLLNYDNSDSTQATFLTASGDVGGGNGIKYSLTTGDTYGDFSSASISIQSGNGFSVGGDNSSGGQVNIRSGGGTAGGGDFSFEAGHSTLSGADGGSFSMRAGAVDDGDGNGGAFDIRGGSAAGGTGDGGGFSILSGNGGFTSGSGGSINLTAGSAQGGDSDGGSVNIITGAGNGAGAGGIFNFISLATGLPTFNTAQNTIRFFFDDGGASITLGNGASADEIKIRSLPTSTYALLDTSLLSSTDKTFQFPNQSGTFDVITDKISLTAQVADIIDTAFSVSTAGLYKVSYYLLDTTADVTAGAVTLNIKFTDNATARTLSSSPVILTATTGITQGQFVTRLASGSITYGVTHTGIFGTADYALYVSLERLI